MLRFIWSTLIAAAAWMAAAAGHASAATVVLYEPGFPQADTNSVALDALHAGFAAAAFVDATQLPATLADPGTDLLVLPYGSAYPEAAWPAILRYLDRGGNLIVLGGKPFTRAAFRTSSGWQLRGPSVAASLELFIHDYQQTPGSAGLSVSPNEDVTPQLPAFQWERAYSPVIRLSVVPMFPNEGGSTGNDDAELTTLTWGKKDAHRLAAPAFLIDHERNRFVGGRWIFLACDPAPHAFDNPQLLKSLQTLALRKNDRFTFRPRLPLFLPGEALEFRYAPSDSLTPTSAEDQLRLEVSAEGAAQPLQLTVPADSSHTITLPPEAASGKGLHTVEATLVRAGTPLWTYRSAFWIRDWNYLLSGPKLTVGSDYFQLDGKPLPVVGTTYMSGETHRLYLANPNAYVWDQDMAQIRGAGLNMIRSGIWSAWNLELTTDDTVSEDGLRTIEAFLMCARRNHLPVQFNLLAFVPDAFGGEHAYLDPAALRAQALYIGSLARRFHDVPFLAWDLINEPSANKNVWRTSPQNDAFEQAAWRAWLEQKYPDQAALLDAWAEPSFGVGRRLQLHPTSTPPSLSGSDSLALPGEGAFQVDQVRSGYNPLKVYDYFLFTQSVFSHWVRRQRAVIRSEGSSQLVTVGQDEGGISGRLSPAFYSPDIDFTADHAWWDFDGILWASLAAKFPGKPMLLQETGEQRRLTNDDHLRLSAEEEGWQLERKIAMSFAQGAGALEWVWNVNAMMANDNEIPIGAIRPDGTEKPEAQVLEGFAKFAAASPASFTRIQPPEVTIVTSQVLLYSSLNALALDTQKHALRAIAYYDHTPVRMLPENRLSELGTPRLVILPAPQALTEAAWHQLLSYVSSGGHLLISGPVSRNEHWQLVDRMGPLHVDAKVLPLAVRESVLQLPKQQTTTQVSFPAAVQQSPIEILRFADGKSVEVISHGKGTILWAADPVEFSEGYQPAAALYAFALSAAGVAPSFRELRPLSPGVLAYPTVLQDAVLYCFSSESLNDETVDIKDAITGARLNFSLAAQRGAVILLHRPDGAILARRGDTPITNTSTRGKS